MYSDNFVSTCKLNTLRFGIILQVFHGQKVVNKANTVSLTCTMRKQNNVFFFFFLQKEKLLLTIFQFPIIHSVCPPKFCVTYCLKMLLGKCNTPRSI